MVLFILLPPLAAGEHFHSIFISVSAQTLTVHSVGARSTEQ